MIGDPDLFRAFLRLLLIEKCLALDGDLFFQLIVAQLLVSVEHDLGDEGLFADDERDGHPAGSRIGFNLNVLEVAGSVENLDLLTKRVSGKAIIHLQRKAPFDRLQFNAFVAANGDRVHQRDGVLRTEPVPRTDRVEHYQ